MDLVEQRLDVADGVDEWAAPPPSVGHQAQGWDLGVGKDARQVAGEATGGCHPARTHRGPDPGVSLLCPRQRRLDGHRGQSVSVEESNELWEEPAGVAEFVAQ